MKESINTYRELLTAVENNPTTLCITKELFDWLYKNTDSMKLTKNKITIKGISTVFVTE